MTGIVARSLSATRSYPPPPPLASFPTSSPRQTVAPASSSSQRQKNGVSACLLPSVSCRALLGYSARERLRLSHAPDKPEEREAKKRKASDLVRPVAERISARDGGDSVMVTMDEQCSLRPCATDFSIAAIMARRDRRQRAKHDASADAGALSPLGTSHH